MRIVSVSTEEKYLFDLLTNAQQEELILQTTDGRQFVLVSLDDWRGFDVGDGDDFEQEVKATTANQALMTFLAARRSRGKRIPLANVKKQLGLN